jgi:hypothetical protein
MTIKFRKTLASENEEFVKLEQQVAQKRAEFEDHQLLLEKRVEHKPTNIPNPTEEK